MKPEYQKALGAQKTSMQQKDLIFLPLSSAPPAHIPWHMCSLLMFPVPRCLRWQMGVFWVQCEVMDAEHWRLGLIKAGSGRTETAEKCGGLVGKMRNEVKKNENGRQMGTRYRREDEGIKSIIRFYLFHPRTLSYQTPLQTKINHLS